MILMGLLAFASNVYASVNFREIYDKIRIIFDDEDSFDERCNSITYSNVKYCACNIGPLNPPANVTAKMLKFRGKANHVCTRNSLEFFTNIKIPCEQQ